MKGFKLLVIFVILLQSQILLAKTKVSGVEFKDDGERVKVIVTVDSAPVSEPELTVKDNIVQIAIPDSVIWPKIEKKVTVINAMDSTLLAYQFNEKTTRVRTMLPFTLVGYERNVSVTVLDKTIELSFPKEGGKSAQTKKNGVATTSAKKVESGNNNHDKYDESYLDKLIQDKESVTKKNVEEKIEVKSVNENKTSQVVDKVGLTHSSISKPNNEKGFSLGVYVGKFVAFLGLVLLLFYGVMALFKKGVLKKGRLGFLNDTQTVTVLNTTYLGPKKSIVLVQVHKQVFLLSVTDKDVQFLSEVKDVTGLIKNGEKEIAGNNFDSDVIEAEKSPKTFKLKDLSEAIREFDETPKITEKFVKEKEVAAPKFADLLKNKVKGLKPLQ